MSLSACAFANAAEHDSSVMYRSERLIFVTRQHGGMWQTSNIFGLFSPHCGPAKREVCALLHSCEGVLLRASGHGNTLMVELEVSTQAPIMDGIC